MRIVILGNYPLMYTQSMHRFADILARGLTARGHDVRVVRPVALFGRLRSGDIGVAKWLSYVDRFLLYPPFLAWQTGGADVIHIADHANAVYVPWLGRRPHVVTCHDMLAIRSALGDIPENRVGWSGRIYQSWILRTLRKAQHVACVSEQSLREWARFGLDSAGSSSVVLNGLNYPYSPMPDEEARERLARMGLHDEAIVLHVGGNQFYKNRLGVARIFAALCTHQAFANHRLVFAGKPLDAPPRAWLADHGLLDRVVETGPVENENLRALYSRADMLLFPSLMEGFGWPIIEAQACGCLVVTTDRPPMNDVGGDAAVYVDPAMADDAAERIVSAWSNRDRLRERGLENATKYTADAMIEGYVATYADVIGREKNSDP